MLWAKAISRSQAHAGQRPGLIMPVYAILLCSQYYNTENFSSISIIVMLNIAIHNNVVMLPSPTKYIPTKTP